MSIRVNKLLSDTNIGLKTLQSILGAFGYNAEDVNLSTKVSDEIADNVRKLCKNDFDFLALLEESAQNEFKGEKKGPDFPLKISLLLVTVISPITPLGVILVLPLYWILI